MSVGTARVKPYLRQMSVSRFNADGYKYLRTARGAYSTHGSVPQPVDATRALYLCGTV